MARSILMSVVLYPVLGMLVELSFGLKFLFFGGLMFVYPKFIRMKPDFVKRKVFWTIQMEAVITVCCSDWRQAGCLFNNSPYFVRRSLTGIH